ncbi:sensor histidine kinase NtrY-like [Polycladidibacter hongkongensis]|uniref:sensor histidine kinase NtrY-like n=1 Tax=Polycladidibacter hongkongensis TaxID=1647556 RepID=UPI0009E9C3D2|nr:PAS domain-containing sensor histidine kinase [Pseudovibrio hongkongensis]
MISKTGKAAPAGPRGLLAALQNHRSRVLGFLVVLLSLVSIVVSFVILMGLSPIQPTQDVVYTALAINSGFVLLLLGLILWEFHKLLKARRKGRAAARLHVRIVALFSIVAAVPAILVAVAATITLDQGLDRWFEKRTRQIISNAQSVAAAYVQEHGNILRSGLIAMAKDVNSNRNSYYYDPTRFDRFFETQTWIRGFLGAYILKRDGTVVMRVLRDPDVEPLLPPEIAMRQAEEGTAVLIAPGVSNLVGGVTKLTDFDELYLYVSRALDPRVVEYQRLAEAGVSEYAELERRRVGVQLAFAIVYVGVALVLLLSAMWGGFGFANQLVRPIRNLIGAADQVSKGNYYVEVEVDKASGDLGNLGQTFNNMTGQLRGQRDALLAANDQIDRRRRFTEAVLSGVSSGVIGLDDDGEISLVNRYATEMLGSSAEVLHGQSIYHAIPELSELVKKALQQGALDGSEGQVTLQRRGRERTINVRVTTEEANRTEHGFVVTLDDITDLVAAQRNSAWADVARRIAHEIKNPLTPIQLSAERIRRRYGKRIDADDKEVFDRCVDTIVRQVGDIGRMVDEFSSFARMPKPRKEQGDLRDTVKEVAFMRAVTSEAVKISCNLPDEPVEVLYDSRLVGQALGNTIKNAGEAVEAYLAANGGGEGTIQVNLHRYGANIQLDVIDSGVGLPKENRQRLLEPYMTTREKGTGLGLAIVRKIMEDHGGGIELLDSPAVAEGGHGALVRLILRDTRAPIEENASANDEGLERGK